MASGCQQLVSLALESAVSVGPLSPRKGTGNGKAQPLRPKQTLQDQQRPKGVFPQRKGNGCLYTSANGLLRLREEDPPEEPKPPGKETGTETVEFIEVLLEATAATEVACVGFASSVLSFRAVPSRQEMQCQPSPSPLFRASPSFAPRVDLGCDLFPGNTGPHGFDSPCETVTKTHCNSSAHPPTPQPLRHRYAVAPGGLPLSLEELLEAEASARSGFTATIEQQRAKVPPSRAFASNCCKGDACPCHAEPRSPTLEACGVPFCLQLPPLFGPAGPAVCTAPVGGAHGDSSSRLNNEASAKGQGTAACRPVPLLQHPRRLNTSACSGWCGAVEGVLALHGALVCRRCLTASSGSGRCGCGKILQTKFREAGQQPTGLQLGLVVALEEAVTGRVLLVLVQNVAAMSLLRYLDCLRHRTDAEALEACAAALLHAQNAAEQQKQHIGPWQRGSGSLVYDALSCNACNAPASWMLSSGGATFGGVTCTRKRIRVEGMLRPIGVGQRDRLLAASSAAARHTIPDGVAGTAPPPSLCLPVLFAVDWEPVTAATLLRDMQNEHRDLLQQQLAL